jgi:hypothetical protein
MARTTESDVQAIYGTSITLAPYIDLAHSIVEGRLSRFNDCGMTDDELTKLETWLAAHFASLAPSDGRQGSSIQSEKEGQLSRSYGGQYGFRLDASQYGQAVQMIDRCNVLVDAGKTRAQWAVL